MRLVLDTNVLVSAFLSQGTPGRLIELAGDGDLLVLKQFQGIRIVTAAQAVKSIMTP